MVVVAGMEEEVLHYYSFDTKEYCDCVGLVLIRVPQARALIGLANQMSDILQYLTNKKIIMYCEFYNLGGHNNPTHN